ncbi:MAG TPA: PspA/IM30 family protein [Drouetiella sp.]|jgi:phage shock protein A
MAKKDSASKSAKKKKSSAKQRKTLASRALKLLDALEEELKDGIPEEWDLFLNRFESIVQSATSFRLSSSEHNDAGPLLRDAIKLEPEIQLEKCYQEMQSSLIQVRQAVATAIATEKQLEQQLQKNKEMAQTWLDRAAMAVSQGAQDLAGQATQRRNQYVEAAEALESQLTVQRETTVNLREQLTELESIVQKAYTNKQILVARSKSASAGLAANESFKKFDSSAYKAALAQMESSAVELETKAKDVRQNLQADMCSLSEDSFASVKSNVDLLLEAVTDLSRQLASVRSSERPPD